MHTFAAARKTNNLADDLTLFALESKDARIARLARKAVDEFRAVCALRKAAESLRLHLDELDRDAKRRAMALYC